MLSDEENNVIDLLKNIDKQKCLMLNCPVVKNNIERQLKIIELNRIIRKQSKEIEELKENNKTLKNLQNDTNRLYIEMIERKNYFERKLQKLEDKIKAKIEEYEKALNILLQKDEWIEPSDTIIRNKFIYYIEFGQSLLEKE